MITSKLLSLISTFPFFMMGFNLPVWSDEIPVSPRQGKSPGRGTRGNCLVVPLLPSGSVVSETRSENPTIWLYVKPSTEVTTNQLSVRSIRDPLDQAKIITLNPNKNPEFIPVILPIGQQKLVENQAYTLLVKCNGDGDSIAVNIKLVLNINFPNTNLSFTQQISNLTDLKLWSEATSLFMNTQSRLVCGNIENSNKLFQANITKLFNSAMRPQSSKPFEPLKSEIQSDILSTYNTKLNQSCK